MLFGTALLFTIWLTVKMEENWISSWRLWKTTDECKDGRIDRCHEKSMPTTKSGGIIKTEYSDIMPNRYIHVVADGVGQNDDNSVFSSELKVSGSLQSTIHRWATAATCHQHSPFMLLTHLPQLNLSTFHFIGHIVVLFYLYVSISVCVGLCITTCICPAFYAAILVINKLNFPDLIQTITLSHKCWKWHTISQGL